MYKNKQWKDKPTKQNLRDNLTAFEFLMSKIRAISSTGPNKSNTTNHYTTTRAKEIENAAPVMELEFQIKENLEKWN